MRAAPHTPTMRRRDPSLVALAGGGTPSAPCAIQPQQALNAPMSGKASGMAGFGALPDDALPGLPERAAIDRSAAAGRGGSIALVLAVAGCLIAAASAIVLL